MIGLIIKNTNLLQILREMIFIDFLKAREGKNKYGIIAQNFNRRTNPAMEHNT